ncbi:polyadenylate-binding protein [Trifolium repens]|nr:polyadenylate-binding protein [Trifolium repens]
MADSEIETATPASLYVGDLHSDVTDDLLYKAFSEFKSLTSVRVCKDSVTGKSLCYGYVNFTSHQDVAIRAIELKNHSVLNGKVIRVMWSSRDADARKSGRGNVFVKNLAESIDNLGLHDLFQKYGKILSSKIVMSEDGKSKGYGYIQFDSEESANDAIEKMNGSTVRDKQIYVGKFIRKSERSFPDPDAKDTNLYIKNLDADITKEHLEEKFSSFGKIISLAIAKDGNGLSKGFGFVNYDNPDDARRAIEAMNGSKFGSKNLYVARAQKKVEREQILHHLFAEKYKGSNIYVKNIDDSVSDEELRNQFSACGTILSAKIMRDDKGISKGFGFVCFSTLDEAVKSVNSFNGCMFHGKPLYVAFAQKKEVRKRLLQLKHAPKLKGLTGPSTAVIHGALHPFIYTATGVVYHPSGSGWSDNGFAAPKAFQQ